jgi:hypothetical protein
MTDYLHIATWCAALYLVAELQNRWLAIAFALVGFVWLLRSLRVQAGAEDPVRPSKGKVSSGT